jgi:class 3 adenylate cyclase
VASVFWPDVLEESARSSLRTTLATLRRALGPAAADVVTATRERVGIEPGHGTSIDLCTFEELVSDGDLEEAATLCRGELLADLDDDWVFEAREEHRRQTLDVLRRLAEAAESSGDLESAVDRSREQVALDPLSEAAQRELIRRLAEGGDQADALAAYRAYAARLRRDLGIAPSAGIRELTDGVRSGSSHPLGNWTRAPERPPLEVHHARCPDCGHENGPDQRFCGACGHALFRACPSCGEENPSLVDFCGACGSLMVPSPRIAAAVEGERRWATVLFGDLAGFTHLSEETDPEDVRLLINGCMSQMGEIVVRYGGWIDKVIGDALMAVFGAPVAHEDDAERAVRTALELQRYAAENGDELGGLALRVGVDSGEVMFAPVGPEDRREPTVMGNTVNTAWRLQQVAPQGSVLIGDQTRSDCRETIRCEAITPIAVKGREAPVAAWLATEAITSTAPEAASSNPMLGRAEELELLRSTWERVVGLRQPQLVSVLGTAGIGKTRLSQELVRFVQEQGHRVVRGRSLPYGESTGYGALAMMIRRIADVFETDPPREAEEKLRRRIEGLIDVGSPRTVLAHVSLLAGLTEDPVDKRSELFASARDFFEALGRERPTLFVFEDVHWADPSLLDLIESVAAHVRESPAMLLTLARGELLDERPSWGGGIPRHTGVSLEPLSPGDAHDLALRSLRGVPDPTAAAERIGQAAGGNPLFVEELTAAMAEGATEPGEQLPVAIRGIISARLDALPAQERCLLLDASVVGNTFWRGALELLAEDERSVLPALEGLEFRELIRRRRVSRMQGDDEFSFKHELIRDVAYATLPRAARRGRHSIVAGFLEEKAGSGADTAAILAHHWREGGESERAVDYLLAAAELAGHGWAKGEAVALYNQALELIPEDDAGRRREIELKRAIDYTAFGHIGDARRALG